MREALAHYLSTSRGVRCSADQVVITSGVQQALDLLARFLLKRDDPVWMEDPGYFGASIAFANAGARIIPVPVDDEGLLVEAGMKLCVRAKGVYLTPGHQFPLGARAAWQPSSKPAANTWTECSRSRPSAQACTRAHSFATA